METLTKHAQQLWKEVSESKIIVAVLALSMGIFIGGIALQSNGLQASLIQNNTTTLAETDLAVLFTEVDDIKEVSINKLSDTKFFIEFFATENGGDVLHPFTYIVEKEGNTVVSIQELD